MTRLNMKLSQALNFARMGAVAARTYPEKLEVVIALLDDLISQVEVLEVPGGLLGPKEEVGC